MRPIARLPSSPSRQRAISTPPPWLATDAAPSDLQALLDQLFGAVTFTANIVLWRQTSYFETTAEMKPLLHILSLEEQYYMLLPAALVLAGRRLRLPLISRGWFRALHSASTVSQIGITRSRSAPSRRKSPHTAYSGSGEVMHSGSSRNACFILQASPNPKLGRPISEVAAADGVMSGAGTANTIAAEMTPAPRGMAAKRRLFRGASICSLSPQACGGGLKATRFGGCIAGRPLLDHAAHAIP
jgi:hypothetical protein